MKKENKIICKSIFTSENVQERKNNFNKMMALLISMELEKSTKPNSVHFKSD